MAKIIIATNPAHDEITQYLEAFLDDIFVNIRNNGEIKFFELKNEQANKEELTSLIERENPRLVLFNGHGSHDSICGFDDCVLIRTDDNELLLKDKIIHSLSCDSGLTLGSKCVSVGTKAFLGFRHKFKMYHLKRENKGDRKNDDMAKLFLDPITYTISSLISGKTAVESVELAKNKYRENLNLLISSDNEKLSTEVAGAVYHDLIHYVCLGDGKTCF
jgi:hypothetical protein